MSGPTDMAAGPTPPGTPVLGGALVLLAGAGLAGLTAGCIRPPEVKVSDIKVTRLTFSKMDLALHFEVTNPNIFDAKVRQFSYRMVAGDDELAAGEVPTPIPVFPAGGTQTIQAPVTVEFKELLGLAEGAGNDRGVSYELVARPVFDVLGFGLPVTLRRGGHIPPIRSPRWSLKTLRYRRGPPSAVELIFDIRNPNAFDLSLDHLSGGLKLGEETLVIVDRPTVEQIAAGERAELTVPVRLSGPALAKVAGKVLSGRAGEFDFHGQFHLKVPPALQKMLLKER